MVILITGASHTGKTALAQKLMQKYQYSESSDHELTSSLWPIAREIIKTAIENKQNLIVEGCYILFDREEEGKQKSTGSAVSLSKINTIYK